jgi:hypothetical protein
MIFAFGRDSLHAYFVVATVFAYGQTSSGKTYTMRGITEKAVNDIYNHIMNVSLLKSSIWAFFVYRFNYLES